MILGEFEETVSYLTERLWTILNGDKASPMTKVQAAKAIAELESMRIEKLFDSGVLERNIGNINILHRQTIRAQLSTGASRKTIEYIQQQMKTAIPKIALPEYETTGNTARPDYQGSEG